MDSALLCSRLLLDDKFAYHIVMALPALNTAVKLVRSGFVQMDRRGLAVHNVHSELIDRESVNARFILHGELERISYIGSDLRFAEGPVNGFHRDFLRSSSSCTSLSGTR